jgi:phage terminase small subunit
MSQKLTAKQQAFVNHYIMCRNATEAATKAGYSKKSARQTGSENLSKAYISEAIEQRTRALTMSADEALMRLTNHARGNIQDFIRMDAYGDPVIDLGIIEADASKGALIKSVTVTKRRVQKTIKTPVQDENGNWKQEKQPQDEEVITVKFDLYDAQSALKEIIKLARLDAGLATDSVQHTVIKTGMDASEL